MKHKPTRFNSHPRSGRDCKGSSEYGFSLPEALTAIVLGALVFVVTATACVAFLKRAWAHDAVAQAESLGSRMSASITSAMKTSSADPINNVSAQGNALVCQTNTASGQTIVVLFAFENGLLTRSENSVANTTNVISNVTPTSSYVFNQDMGLVSGNFQIRTPVERLTFDAYGTSSRMR
jgi:Tfp pilus assembly protein PilV